MNIVDMNDRVIPSSIQADGVEQSFDHADRGRLMEVQYERTVSYINGLARDVAITDRNGLSIGIKGTNKSNVSCTSNLEVMVIYRFMNYLDIDPYSILSDEVCSRNEELNIIRDELTKVMKVKRRRPSHITITIKYKFTLDTFRQHGDNVYCTELNSVFSLLTDGAEIPTHPESDEGKLVTTLHPKDEYSLNIHINDPRGVFGERFVNVLGKVYRVPTIRNKSKKPGVYVKGSADVHNERSGNRFGNSIYEFSEASELTYLYLSASEADTYGDPGAIVKRELEQLKQEYAERELQRKLEIDELEDHRKRLEQEYKRQDIEHKRILLDLEAKHKAEEARLKAEEMKSKAHALELDSKRTQEKHHLETESAVRQKILAEDKYNLDRRKNESSAAIDFLKWIPAAIGAVVGICAFFFKFTS